MVICFSVNSKPKVAFQKLERLCAGRLRGW